MKIISPGLSILFSVTCYLSQAQAYWVTETNAHQKNYTIVRFYDEHHRLICEERQQGVYLNPAKRRHRKKLDAMLKSYLMSDILYSGRRSKRKNEDESVKPTIEDLH